MSEDFTLMAVDVDGSLANPIVQIAVLTWGIAIAILLIIIFRYTELRWQRIAVAAGALMGGTLLSPFANRGIAMFAYQMLSRPGVTVGFFGGPPVWASPLVAMAVTGACTLVIGYSPRHKKG